jgi:hypothetical protein
MYRTLIALAGVVSLAACSSNSTSSTGKTQAQLATDLCTALAANCAAGSSDDQFENETETQCEDSVKTVYDTPADTTNDDDLTCRVAEAQAAASDPTNKSAHCKNAGPTGGGGGATGAGKCGSLCNVYCDLQDRNCTSANPAFVTASLTPNFTDHTDCETKCAAEITSGAGTHFSTGGGVNKNGGDSIQCRIWHLGKAQAGPSPHCFHTKLVSATSATVLTGGPCSGPVQ